MTLGRQNEQASECSTGNWLSEDYDPGLVSVLIPTFNRAALLPATLETILAQTYEQIEVIVVDDGSTDNTSEVLELWQDRFQSQRGWRFRVDHQENLRAAAARNRAARQCRGQWVNFFDDDDLMAVDKIANQVRALTDRDADIAYGPHAFFIQDDGGYWLGQAINETPPDDLDQPFEAWLGGWDWGLTTSLISRLFLNRVEPLNESMIRDEDVEYKIRILEKSPKIVHASDGVVFARRHAGSVSHNRSSRAQEDSLANLEKLERYSLKKIGHAASRERLARLWGYRAIRCYEDGASESGRYCVRKALEHDATYRPKPRGLAARCCYVMAGVRGLGWEVRMRKRLSQMFRSRLGISLGTLRRVNRLPLGGASHRVNSAAQVSTR